MRWLQLRVLAASFLILGAGCDKTPPAPAPAPVTAASVAVRTATAEPAASMSLDDFCTQFDAKIRAIAASCEVEVEEEPASLKASLRKTLEVNVAMAKSGCLDIRNVELVADRAAACLAELKTHWDASWTSLANPACRAAFRGKTAIGADCLRDQECPTGSYCVSKLEGDDVLARACSPIVEEGTPCRMGVGSVCGPSFFCKQGKCNASAKLGESCDIATVSACDHGLICLRERGSDTKGKCGPLRKAGEACHHWTECLGACVTPSSKVKDGICESFCSSG